ncbi:DUF423 domain-containing protein [Fulvivirgaceae bacterium BMA10]|uniref:DUF423 domain-containing protein n=1 Tax=Splendidivirga corallicola TaxID=3051826 RepID=A0ABT8KX51_9BACT|nr:DUF423 domain-containing protein [Fulvivirgaceae bacterium BMA10]
MQKRTLIAASILGGLAVMIGAFGAHALKEMLEVSGRTETFETAVKYQFYHALTLLFIGLGKEKIESRFLNYAAISMITGTIIFSGSLYILCLSGTTIWGAVTPVGGVLLIAGWVLMLLAIIKAFK